MIAIDTNVLLRYLLEDDEIQSPKANKLINSSKKRFLPILCLQKQFGR